MGGTLPRVNIWQTRRRLDNPSYECVKIHLDVGCIMHLVQFGFGDGEARREEFATKSRNL